MFLSKYDNHFLTTFSIAIIWLFLEAKFNSNFILDDNRVENIQAGLLLFATFGFLRLTMLSDNLTKPLMLVISFTAALLFLEEISWGQRIIGYNTPDIIANQNSQKETNLHNLYFSIVFIPGFLTLIMSSVMLWVNRPIHFKSYLIIPKLSRFKWCYAIFSIVMVVFVAPLLLGASGITLEHMEKIFNHQDLWQMDKSLLMQPSVWDEMGLTHKSAENIILIYQFNESIETLIYLFVFYVSLVHPKNW